MNRREQLAWVAGLIDGEGCVGIDYKRKPKEYRHPSYRLRLRVNMTHRRTIERLKEILKIGTVRRRKAANKRCKDQYVWSIGGNDARRVLIVLLPMLCTKRRDAELGIAFRNFMNKVAIPGRGSYPRSVIRKQHSFYLKMRKKWGNYWTSDGGS